MTKQTFHNRPAYTVPIPATRENPVPSGVSVERNPGGGATAIASRRLDKRRLHVTLFRRFGNRVCWPIASGRRWLLKINPPADAVSPDAEQQERVA